jgi:RNA polymerase sigma-70 factor (ECF subfamily)
VSDGSASAADPERLNVERTLAGDVDGFAPVVDRWQRPLIDLAYRYCRDRDLAEALAQETLVRAFLYAHRWRADVAFSTWLLALALRVIRPAVRRHKWRDASRRASPGTAASDADRAVHAVTDVVSGLPRRQRDALILYDFLGQDRCEAARVLAVPLATFEQRLDRGRALLKDRLQGVVHGASPQLDASADFSSRVMRAIHREAQGRPVPRRPPLYYASGAIGLGSIVAALFVVNHVLEREIPERRLADPVTLLALTVAGSIALVRWLIQVLRDY